MKKLKDESRIIKYLPIIYLLFFCLNIYSTNSLSEGTSPFNQFMAPEGGVNLSSGDVSFPFPLYKLPGRNGMDIDVSLAYSSNVHMNVRAKNDKSPTGWMGLGWRLGYGSIRCIHNGTRIDTDDEYYWISPEGISQRIYKNEDGKFFLEKKPYWKVIRFPEDGVNETDDYIVTGWVLIDPTGKKYIYGNPDESSYPGLSDLCATRYTFWWPPHGYVGAGFEEDPSLFPYQWDLCEIEDLYGNSIKFEYDTTGEDLATSDWSTSDLTNPVFYTKESYLRKITNPQEDSIVFYTSEKDFLEYLDPKRVKDEPDAYIELFEKKKLDSVNIFVKGSLFRKFIFCYKNINIRPGENYLKRLLVSIEEQNIKMENIGKTVFKYYDDIEKFDEINAISEEGEEGYNLGALKKIIYPRCGSVEYEYTKQCLNNSQPKKDDNEEINYDVVSKNGGIVDKGNEFFVYNKRLLAENKMVIYTWDGSNWDEQIFIEGTEGWYKEIYCGNEYFVVVADDLVMFFWNKITKQWEKSSELISMSTDDILIHPFRDHFYVIDTDDEIIKNFSIDFESREVTEDINVTYSGDDEEIIGVGDKIIAKYDNQGSTLHTQYFDGENWIGHSNGDPEYDRTGDYSLFVGPDYVVLYNKPSSKEYAYVEKWRGSWVDRQKIEIPQGNDFEVIPGDDFFVVNHTKKEEFSLFQWNGEKWKRKIDRKDLGAAVALYIKAGNDFFVVNYPVWLSGDCKNNRRREKFRIYQWDGKSWKQGYRGKFSLGDIKEKKFIVGYDFVVAKRWKTAYRNARPDFVLNGKVWNGSEWNENQKEIIYFHTGDGDNKRVILGGKLLEKNLNEKLIAKNNALAGAITVKKWKNDGRCEDGYFPLNGTIHYGKLFLAKKFKDSFVDKVYSYVVSSKKIYDGISRLPSEPQGNDGNWANQKSIGLVPGIQVIKYEFDIDKKILFNTLAGTAMYERVSITNENGSKTEYNFICDKQNRRLFGKIRNVNNFDRNLRLVSKTEYEYEDDFKNAEWPRNIYQIRLLSKSTTINDLKTKVCYHYNNENGMPDMEARYNSEDKKKIVVTNFAFQADDGIYGNMNDLNMISQPCQITVYDTPDPLWAVSNPISSDVTKWELNTTFGIYVPSATYAWNAAPDDNGNLPDEVQDFDFDGNDEQVGWLKIQLFSKYSTNGILVEERDGSDYNNGMGIASSTFFGHQSSIKIAGVSNASFNECAFFTCDYDDYVIDGTTEYFDGENGWEKGGAFLDGPPVFSNKIIKHFGDSIVHVNNSNDGPTKTITGLISNRDYIFSAWVYPIDVSSSKPVMLTALLPDEDPASNNENEKGDLKSGQWNLISRTIHKGDIIDNYGNAKDITIQISSENGADFLIEDIRFHPKNTFPATMFYDTLNRAVAVVDGYHNNIKNEYDSWGRVKKEFHIGADGQDTLLTMQEYHTMTCNCLPYSTKLKELNLSSGDFGFDPYIFDYDIIVANAIDEIKIDALAKNTDATIRIYVEDILVFDSECPCGATYTISPLLEGDANAVTIKIIVTTATGVEGRPYIITIKRMANCWVYSGNPDVTGYMTRYISIEMYGSIPCLAYRENYSGKTYVKYLNGENWDIAGSDGNGDGIPDPASEDDASFISFTTDDTKLYIAFSEISSASGNNVVIMKEMNGINGTWTQLGGAISNSAPGAISISVYKPNAAADPEIYVAYTANKFDEEGLDPPDDDHTEMKIYVKKWDESSSMWTNSIATPDINVVGAYGTGATSIELALDENGDLFIAYLLEIVYEINANGELVDDEMNENDGKLFVLNYNESQNQWEQVGTGSVSDERIEQFSFKVKSLEPYIVYSEFSTPEESKTFNNWSASKKILVKKYSSSIWQDVKDDGAINPTVFYADGNERYDLSFRDGDPMLAFTNMFNEHFLTTITFEGSTWETFLNPAIAQSYSGINNTVSIAVNSNNSPHMPYVAFGNGSKNNQTSIIQWDGNCYDATILNMTINSAGSSVSLFPEFKQYIVNYAAEIKGSNSNVEIELETRSDVNQVLIDGKQATEGSNNLWSAEVNINVGEKIIPIKVIASDNETSAKYSVKIIRPSSSCASLCGFDLIDKAGNLIDYTPEFLPTEFGPYKVTVPNTTDKVFIRPSANNDPWISINGDHNPSGYYSNEIQLRFGDNEIYILVKSPNSEEEAEYILVVTRRADPDESLSDLSLGLYENGTHVNNIDLNVDDETFEFLVDVEQAITSVTVTPTIPASSSSVIHVNMVEVSSNTQSDPISISTGAGYINVDLVNSEKDILARYIIKVIRKPGSNCSLNNFEILAEGIGTIDYDPDFNSYIYDYNASVILSNDVSRISVIPTATDPNATISLNYLAIEDRETGNFVDLNTGNNNIVISVHSDDNVDRINYHVNVTRAFEEIIPEVYFNKSKSSAQESINGAEKSIVKLVVNLSEDPTEDTDISFTQTNVGAQGSAEEGADFNFVTQSPIRFELCEARKEIEIEILDDELIEGDETIDIELAVVSGNADLGGTVQHTLTIIDDDFPKVSFDQKSTDVIEGTVGAENIIDIGVTIEPPPPNAVDAYFELYHASYGLTEEDYELLDDNMVHFTPADDQDMIQVKIFGDLKVELNEYFILQLLPGPGVEIDPLKNKHKVTIINDDTPVIYVDFTRTDGRNNGSSWDDAFLKLQDALDFTRNHLDLVKEIHVSEGNYHPVDLEEEVIPTDEDRNASFELVEGVLLKGGFSSGAGSVIWDPEAYVTKLDGDIDHNDDPQKELIDPDRNSVHNSKHVVKYSPASNIATTIEGVTIYGGYSSDDISGAAILSNGSIKIKQCKIRYNYSKSRGNVYDPREIENCRFEHNWVGSCDDINDGGGAVWADNSLTKLENSYFKENYASCRGGALYINNNNSLIVFNCTFRNNSASHGGAIFYRGLQVRPKVINCVFIANQSKHAGGSIHVHEIGDSYRVEFANCVFSNNQCVDETSGAKGGAVFFQNVNNDILFETCTFFSNSVQSQAKGGAISCEGGNISVSNSIFYENKEGEMEGVYPDIYHPDMLKVSIYKCNIQLSDLNIEYLDNICVDPVFESINPDDQNFLKLASTSPCINIGDKSVLWSLPLIDDKDLEGNPRIQQEEIDLGAYESGHSGYNRVINFALRWEELPEYDNEPRQIQVTISQQPDQTITIPFTISGTAEEGVDKDYHSIQPSNRTITFYAGVKIGTISYYDVEDGDQENDETIIFNLGEPLPSGSSTVGDPKRYIRVIDEDSAP